VNVRIREKRTDGGTVGGACHRARGNGLRRDWTCAGSLFRDRTAGASDVEGRMRNKWKLLVPESPTRSGWRWECSEANKALVRPAGTGLPISNLYPECNVILIVKLFRGLLAFRGTDRRVKPPSTRRFTFSAFLIAVRVRTPDVASQFQTAGKMAEPFFRRRELRGWGSEHAAHLRAHCKFHDIREF